MHEMAAGPVIPARGYVRCAARAKNRERRRAAYEHASKVHEGAAKTESWRAG
jgi:hypothetical protein